MILFQRLNLHLQQASQCTLHTAQFTLNTTSANTPESENVPLILNIEHCTMYAAHQVFILHFANVSFPTTNIQNFPELVSRFTLQKSECTLIYALPGVE